MIRLANYSSSGGMNQLGEEAEVLIPIPSPEGMENRECLLCGNMRSEKT